MNDAVWSSDIPWTEACKRAFYRRCRRYGWPRYRETLCFRNLDYRCAGWKGVSLSSLKSVIRLSRPTSA